MREEENSVLSKTKSAVLADIDISVKSKYQLIYQPGRYISRSLRLILWMTCWGLCSNVMT